MMFFVSLILASVPSFARQPSVSCTYLMHTVRNAEIRYDSWYENPFEMRNLSAGHAKGTATFEDGSWLTVETLMQNGAFYVKAQSGVADFVRRELTGKAVLVAAPHIYRIERREDVSDTSTELQFPEFKITCSLK